MVEKHHSGNVVNKKNGPTITKKQASTQTDRCLESDITTRDKLIETDPLFCWNCSQLIVTMETTGQIQAALLNTTEPNICNTENKEEDHSPAITPTKLKATKGEVTPNQTGPRDSMTLMQRDSQQTPQTPRERNMCNNSPTIGNRNIQTLLKKCEDKFQRSDISIRPENDDPLKGPLSTQRVQNVEAIYDKVNESTHGQQRVSSVKEKDQTQKKKHRKKVNHRIKNMDQTEQCLEKVCALSTLKPTQSNQTKMKTETVLSNTTNSNFKQNGSQNKTDKKNTTGLNCTHIKSVYLGGKKSKMNESDLETILQDFEREYTTVCLQCEEEAQSQKFPNSKKSEDSKKMEEYAKQGARPKELMKTKGPYFSGDSSRDNFEKASSNHSKNQSNKPKESSREPDYISMMKQWPANIGKSSLLKKEKAKYVCKVKEALNYVVYFRPVDYCVSEVQLDSPHSIPMVGENRMGLLDFADLFLMHDLLPYYQTPPAADHYEMVFETLTVRGTPLDREVFVTHQNSASRQDGTQDSAPNHKRLPSFNEVFTPKTNTPLSNTIPCQKNVSPTINAALKNIKNSPIKVPTAAAPKSKSQKNLHTPKSSASSNATGVPDSPIKKTLTKPSEGTMLTESSSHEFKTPSPKHASLSVTLQQPVVMVSPIQDLHISAVHAPPSAPLQAPPSAPQSPPTASQAPLSAPEAKLSAPQAPLSVPEAKLSAPQAPLSAPEAKLSTPYHTIAKSDQSIITTQNVKIIITPPEDISNSPPIIKPTIRRATRLKGPILCMACNGAGCGDHKKLCYAEVYRDMFVDDMNSHFSDSSDSTIFDFDESVDYEESLNSFSDDDTDVMSPPPTYEKAIELGMTKNNDTNTGLHTRIKRLPRPHLSEKMSRCMNCRRRKGVHLKQCFRCDMATYCCKECQLEDHQRHREECKRIYKWKCACQRLEPYMLHYLTSYNLQVVTEFRQVPDCYQSLQGFNRALLCEVTGRCDYYAKDDYAVFIQDESGLEVPLVFSVNEGSYYMPNSSQPIPLSRLLYPGRFIIFLHPVWLLFQDFREGFRLTDLRNMFVIKELSEL